MKLLAALGYACVGVGFVVGVAGLVGGEWITGSGFLLVVGLAILTLPYHPRRPND